VVLLHGQDTSLLVWSDPSGSPGQASIGTALASVGFVCVAIFDEGNGWGNDAAVADIDTARLYLGTLGCATDKVLLVGASMGAVDALNYTRAHPDRVAAVIGLIPGSDVDDIRDNNRAGTTRRRSTSRGASRPVRRRRRCRCRLERTRRPTPTPRPSRGRARSSSSTTRPSTPS
jgi:pimeloyl-ACP methyl ester carboxylesterase